MMKGIRLLPVILLVLSVVSCGDVVVDIDPAGRTDSDTTGVVPADDVPVDDDVPIPVGSVTFDRDSLILAAGAADTISVRVLPENATDRIITWYSSDSDVAAVNGGIITAVAAGSAVITASAGSETARCTVTVERNAQTLSFDVPSIEWAVGMFEEYEVGGTYSLPQIAAGAETEVVYSSSDISVAEICGDSIIINGSGTTTITATAVPTGIYAEASASYTLDIERIEAFNLENPSVCAYLDEAGRRYNDHNISVVSFVDKYSSNSAKNKKDVPSPAIVRWEKSAVGTEASVSVFSDSEMSVEVADATTAADSVAIYNLIPGNTYYYKVTESGCTVKTGRFSTYGRCRMLKISDTYGSGCANNCRDLGGLKTEDGRTLRYGLIYRGSNMDATTDAEKDYIAGRLGIMADIDLRKGIPTSTSTTSIYGLGGCNRPFYDDRWDVYYVYAGFENFDDLTTRSKIRKIFNCIIISAIEGEPCYIHCAAGADRTGYICMLLEAALGVGLTECSIDYEMTSFSIVGLRTRTGTQGDLLFSTGRRYIAQYGAGSFCENACRILLDAGITQAQLDAFREVMLQ